MDVKITYPVVAKYKIQRQKWLNIVRWPVAAAAVFCPIINLFLGGKAWSVVVLMSLYMVWTLALSPDLVEYNRLSQVSKFFACSCILLILIDVCLSSGWAVKVVPHVCYSGMIISSVLFFTDIDRQKQNMRPMIILIFISFLAFVVAYSLWHEKEHWALWVMGAISFVLMIIYAVMLWREFPRALRKRLHVK